MTRSVFPDIKSASATEWEWPRADRLHAALSSAAVYAELARMCGTWSADRIEDVVENRIAESRPLATGFRPATKDVEPSRSDRKKSFYALRNGSTLKPYRAVRIQAAFPRSNIMLWWKHPLAEVLCNPQLGIDAIVEWLKMLPRGPVRRCIWEPVATPTPGFKPERLTAWTPLLVSSLERVGNDVALFALIARLRIEQLLGNSDGGLEAAQAAWNILPLAMASRTNILVSKDALIIAMDYFLSWQPFADTRLLQLAHFGGSTNKCEAIEQCEAIWSADTSVPEKTKLLRKSLAPSSLFPEIGGDWGWWNMIDFYGPIVTFPASGSDLSP